VTQGASGDLQSVTKLAREMVTRFGFSSLGPVALEAAGSEVFLGRDLVHTRPNYAESTGKAIDEQIRELAMAALNQAVELLRSRREEMDRLVEALMEEETLNSERFLALAGLSDQVETVAAQPGDQSGDLSGEASKPSVAAVALQRHP
ncbi:MAG: hypothetical protein AB8B70_07950, partial [Prochlorococcus sp.]